MIGLGVNIDHVATIREARRGREPDPVWAAVQAELGGADGITLHVREDRRHIQDRDARLIRQTVQVRYNLEMAATEEMLALALELKPDQVTLVPERREEVTTEGGLDVAGNRQRLTTVTKSLRDTGVEVSMFIGPDRDQVQASYSVGATSIELHTGQYAEATQPAAIDHEFESLRDCVALGQSLGLVTHLGHGLNYHNTQRVCSISGVRELNIGHSIISRAVFVGLCEAVREMKQLILISEPKV